MKYNGELKIIDTQEKAYLLGFLYGDGCISYSFTKSNTESFSTNLNISEIDVETILNLKECFPFFNFNMGYCNKHNKNHNKQVVIRKLSKELYNDLMLHGMYPRKSFENAPKLKIPNIDDNLMSHFIRGFFDADGTVCNIAKRKNLIYIGFSSVAYNFLNEINLYLKNKNINSWKISSVIPKIKNRQICYNLIFHKTFEILKLINFMYKDANISLKRKANKCLQYKPINKVIDRNITCPKCNSNKTWSHGIRNKSNEYLCKNCGKYFRIKQKLNQYFVTY